MRSPSARPSPRIVLRRMMGSPSDWYLRVPQLSVPRPAWSWVGPTLIAGSVGVSWLAYAEFSDLPGYVAWGMFVGTASIVLMAWSFVLALRPRLLEPLFGGLDNMYRVHRWVGILAVVAMLLHTDIGPELKTGILGASRPIANISKQLAEIGSYTIYVLVGISLLRWFPYRYWRWTHKLMGIPFAFACWHFFTSRKTFANGSGWGWYFGTIMLIGLFACVGRLVGYDMVARGRRYRVASITRHANTAELQLEPVGRKLKYEVGQFASIKLQAPGLTEPHMFTIASAPQQPDLRFYIRDLGDWTAKVHVADLVGVDVFVAGPYGEFRPLPRRKAPTYWIAGGVGITPFLSAIDSIGPADEASRPTLLYCVRSRAEATAVDALERAVDDDRIHLEWFESSAGRRFDRGGLAELVGQGGLAGAHVGVCGPAALVAAGVAAARSLGARHIETEGFDIRGGLGPNLSLTVEELLGR